MRLVLLRHGTAVPHGVGGLEDDERPLIAEGEREARNAGRALHALKLRPDVVVTSPFVRARQTAKLAAAELGLRSVVDEALRPGFDRGALEALVERHPGDTLVLVGHDPDLSNLLRELTGAQASLAKGGVARIDMAEGELRWLLRPAALRLIAKAA